MRRNSNLHVAHVQEEEAKLFRHSMNESIYLGFFPRIKNNLMSYMGMPFNGSHNNEDFWNDITERLD